MLIFNTISGQQLFGVRCKG